MKTVSGTIISSKPVNLSKAASILSNFVNSDNGTSQSVSTYLRRTSTAFNELVSFRKHHKRKKHQPVEEDSSKSDVKPRNSEEDEVRVLENGGGVNRKFDHDPVEEKENGNVEGKLEKKEKKKKKKEKGGLGKSGEFEEDNEIVKEKKKKKRKNAEVEGDESGNSKKKKKKKRRTEADV